MKFTAKLWSCKINSFHNSTASFSHKTTLARCVVCHIVKLYVVGPGFFQIFFQIMLPVSTEDK